MKKSLVFLIMILILVSTSSCVEQKFPEGKQVPPPGASHEDKAEPKAAPEVAPVAAPVVAPEAAPVVAPVVAPATEPEGKKE